jgi:hypothetical protein
MLQKMGQVMGKITFTIHLPKWRLIVSNGTILAASTRASAGRPVFAQQMLAMTHSFLLAEIDLFLLAFVKKGEGQACPRSGQM